MDPRRHKPSQATKNLQRLIWLIIFLALLWLLFGCGKGMTTGPYTATVSSKYHEPHQYIDSDGRALMREEIYYIIFDVAYAQPLRVLGQNNDTQAIFDAVESGKTYCFEMAASNILRVINDGECKE